MRKDSGIAVSEMRVARTSIRKTMRTIMVPERKDPAFDFIDGNRPVTEDQVRQKLVSDGWTDVQVVLRGRFFLATASKGGELGAFSVDALTGRLRGEDGDCDDPLYDYDDIVTATKRPQ
jgi:hypothetical protein